MSHKMFINIHFCQSRSELYFLVVCIHPLPWKHVFLPEISLVFFITLGRDGRVLLLVQKVSLAWGWGEREMGEEGREEYSLEGYKAWWWWSVQWGTRCWCWDSFHSNSSSSLSLSPFSVSNTPLTHKNTHKIVCRIACLPSSSQRCSLWSTQFALISVEYLFHVPAV